MAGMQEWMATVPHSFGSATGYSITIYIYGAAGSEKHPTNTGIMPTTFHPMANQIEERTIHEGESKTIQETKGNTKSWRQRMKIWKP